MSSNHNSFSDHSRRKFLYQATLASLGVICAGKSAWAKHSLNLLVKKPDSKFKGVQVGVITYSFRSMPGKPEQLLQYCIDANISAIELMGDSVEDYAGKPINTVKLPPRVPGQQTKLSDEQKAQVAAYQQSVVDWRTSVAMDKFEELRKLYHKAGVSIYAFKPNALNSNNTDGEIEYALKAAKALGAKSVTLELPADPAHSKRLGDLGEKHKIYIGYHAHLQATDAAWDTALAQSPYNSMNLDCGHYIAAGGNNTKESLLALIEAKHDRITSLHIKDRKTKTNGGNNVVWGLGDTPIKEILVLLKEKKYKIPATIELEYDIPAGSNAVEETKKCVAYAKRMLEG
ncbi:MAG: TIM barrel protein [Sediminibacterium sp.]